MFGKIYCAALDGIEANMIQIEADVSDGLPVFDMVGMLSSEVREARERVRVAMKNSGYTLPPKRVTVNMSPANIRKEGTAFDLPIAIAVLIAGGYLVQEQVEGIFFIGELSLNGSVQAVNGVLPMVYEARRKGFTRCIVPKQNDTEARVIEGILPLPVETLRQTVELLQNPLLQEEIISKTKSSKNTTKTTSKIILDEEGEDFSDLIGQKLVRRAMEVAAAGHHNILMLCHKLLDA